MDGVVKSAGESAEDYNIVLRLRYGSGEPSGGGVGRAYPVRLRFKVGETRDAFHKVGSVLIPILDDSNTLRTKCSLQNVPGMLEIYLRQVIFLYVLPDGVEVTFD